MSGHQSLRRSRTLRNYWTSNRSLAKKTCRVPTLTGRCKEPRTSATAALTRGSPSADTLKPGAANARMTPARKGGEVRWAEC